MHLVVLGNNIILNPVAKIFGASVYSCDMNADHWKRMGYQLIFSDSGVREFSANNVVLQLIKRERLL